VTKSFCDTCSRFVDPEIVSRLETLAVKSESVTVHARVAVCPACSTELSNETLDDETLAAAFAVYRVRHGLLQPDEIREIRLKYSLGQKAFSKLLGWGEITLHRYESGSLQNSSQNTVLELARDPLFIAKMIERNGGLLSQDQRNLLRARLAELVAECPEQVAREEAAPYGVAENCIRKLREMIVLFAEGDRTFRTKLNKLLFYADFLHCKRHGSPISGIRYVHLQYGPVPVGFLQVQAGLVDDSSMSELQICASDWNGTRFHATRPADLSVFSDTEIECLEFVAKRFHHWSAKRLSELSHSEAAWADTRDRETIPYSFADRLSLD
jgi:putative zinc finger/helix-turn-helix YgiT family protein